MWGVGCGVWGVGVVGNLAEISLNPHLPKSLSRSLPTPQKENLPSHH
ncbi:Similar to A0ZGM6_NODSP Indole-3-glycerol-phosphate synthase (fragment) [Microcystis aeruginosa PCC 9809]|uniref:Similar to A0ZGM6_NODSP Indole-3-glycerol-phosphate synthase n=1 Tax=Microcystis aeruginosa PCC 9809 TaxID=1160285 RepID=I4HZ28_MICAE